MTEILLVLSVLFFIDERFAFFQDNSLVGENIQLYIYTNNCFNWQLLPI